MVRDTINLYFYIGTPPFSFHINLSKKQSINNSIMKKQSLSSVIVMALMVVTLLSCTRGEVSDDALSRAEKLLARMTLDEKIGQMSQFDAGVFSSSDQIEAIVREGRAGSVFNFQGPDKVNRLQRTAVEESRLGIPLLIGRDVIHGYRTIFPIPLGMAASWNPAAVGRAFRIAATEASSQGINWTFAPMLDITWDPRWGRIAEGCGEDPFLAATLAYAMVKGIQGDSLTDPTAIAACAKHYAGYGFSEGGRDYGTTYITEPVLRNVVLRPFRAALDAGVLTIMTAFNDLNGVPATANSHLIREILRDEWSFDGVVVSDYASVTELINHGYALDEMDAAAKAINAGVEMEMATSSYHTYIKALLEERRITLQQIDDAVRNILKVKYQLGLFENPYVNSTAEDIILDPSFLEHARAVARQSIVMLKNKNKSLPLVAEKISSVAVIGPLADAPRDQLGTWCFDGQAENSVTPLEAITGLLGEKRVNYVPGLTHSRDKNRAGFATAVAAARRSEAILFFGGEEWILSGEGQSRGNINLPGAQGALIDELAATGKPLIIVLMAGRPLAVGEELEAADALLYAWHGGTMAGPAVADLLFGAESPSGKLPVTFVKGEGQIPFYYYRKNSGRPGTVSSWTPIDQIPVINPQNSLGYKSYHLDYGYTPLLPFGFGLSYTTFEYSDLNISSGVMKMEESLTVSATVKNSGNWDADEIVQFYIRDRVGSITRPVKELKGYQRLHIRKGESIKVCFTLTAADLAFYNGTDWVTEPGMFDLWIAPDSDEGLHGEFTLE